VFYYWGHFPSVGDGADPVWGAPTTFAMISDGTSNTLMVGERPSYPDLEALGSPGGWQCGAWVYSEVDSALGLPNSRLWCGSQGSAGAPVPRRQPVVRARQRPERL
jgi:hypothetical protein